MVYVRGWQRRERWKKNFLLISKKTLRNHLFLHEFQNAFYFGWERERKTDRERMRERETDRQRENERERERQTDRQTDRQRGTFSQAIVTILVPNETIFLPWKKSAPSWDISLKANIRV
jgi:hypothetical protein